MLIKNKPSAGQDRIARMFGEPMGYVDGPNTYQLELSDPITGLDPTGLANQPTTGQANGNAAGAPPAVPLTGQAQLLDLIQQARALDEDYAYYKATGLDKLYDSLSQAANSGKVTVVNVAKGQCPTHPNATALTDPNGPNGLTIYLTPNATPIDTVHEMVHVLQQLGQAPKGTGSRAIEEGEAWGVAQAGYLQYNVMFRTLEDDINKGDFNAAQAQWAQIWGPRGLPSAVGFVTFPADPGWHGWGAKPAETVCNSDFQNITSDLGVTYSASALATLYNQMLKAKGSNLVLTPPAGLPSAFK